MLAIVYAGGVCVGFDAHAHSNRAAAQTKPLSGSFGFLIDGSSQPTSSNNGLAILGVMNLDGAGGVTGTYTFALGADSSNPAQTAAGTLTGTYSTNPDGAGSLTISADTLTLTFAMVIGDGGQSLQWRVQLQSYWFPPKQ